MLKKKLLVILTSMFLSAMIAVANADPIVNTTEFLTDGTTSYGYYTNSGELMFIQEGNDSGSHLGDVETAIEDFLNFNSDDFVLTATNVTFTTNDALGNLLGTFPDDLNGGDIPESRASGTGTWAASPAGTNIGFYSVKTGNAFAMYRVFPVDSTGSWSTFDLWKEGYGGNGAIEVSHFTGFNPSAPVPEPATLLLFGTGLVGLAGFARKKRN